MQTISFVESKIFKAATLLIVFTISISVLIIGKSFLIPLAWGILIALASIRMLDKVEKKLKINRLFSSILFVLLVLLCIILLFFFFYSEIKSIISGMPSFTNKVSDLLHSLLSTAESYGIPIPENLDKNLIHDWLHNHSQAIAAALARFGKSFGNIFLVAIYLFFLTLFRENYLYYLALREKTTKGYNEALKKYDEVMDVISNFIYGYFIMTLVLAIMLFIVFLLIGLKYALFFAILVALLTLIPYIGYPIGMVMVFVFAAISYDGYLIPLLALGGILLSNMLKSYIFKPIIIGDKIKLNAFIIFISVIIGGMIWGVTGMIIFMPLFGIVKVLLEYNEKTKPLAALLTTVPKGALNQNIDSKVVNKKK